MSNKAAGVVAASDVGILKNNVFDIIAAITAWLSYVPNCSLHVAEEAVVTVTAVIDCQVPDDVVVAIEITSERMVWRADGCPVLPAHVEVGKAERVCPPRASAVDPRKLFCFDPSKVLTGGGIFILPCYFLAFIGATAATQVEVAAHH